MALSVSYRCGSRFDITAGNHTIITDQPVEDGGADAGMSPVELFVGSLASCVAYFVGRFCARHGIPREGLAVEAEWEMAEKPHRVGRIALAIHLPHPVTVEQRERLLKVAHGCTVHQSIAVPAKVIIELTPVSQAADRV
ncbi:OsmC family protein [Nitrospira sp. Nam80]